MGLGLYVGAKIKPAGLFKKKPAPKQVFQKIEKSALKHLQNKGLNYASTSIHNNILYLSFYPAEEDVAFFVNNDNYLICSAKTSSAGPGYHAFLVNMLETIGLETNLEWIWHDEEKDFIDETDYFPKKDFSSLQAAMITHLHAISNHLVEHDDLSNIALSLPMHLSIVHSHYAASPLGFWEKKFFEEVSRLQKEDGHLLKYAEQFFPWWDEEIDAEFWKNLALVQMWLNVPWHPAVPGQTQSMHDLSLALDCLLKAQKLDTQINIPEQEMQEIKGLLSINDLGVDYPIPDQNKIGYKRLPIRKPLTGGWSVITPGFFYKTTEDDHSTIIFYYDTKTVRGCSVSFEGAKSPIQDIDNQDVIAKIDTDELKGKAIQKKVSDENGDYWILECEISSSNSVCILTICYEKEDELAWAIETFNSVQHTQPNSN